MSECLVVSLPELVASGCLSKCTLSLNEDGDGQVDIKNLRLVNAAKVSLLLAQTVARIDNSDENHKVNVISLKMNNFFVKLTCPPKPSKVGDAASDRSCDEIDRVIGNEDTFPLDFKTDPSLDGNSLNNFMSGFLDSGNSEEKKLNTASENYTEGSRSSSCADQSCSSYRRLGCDQNKLASDMKKFANIVSKSGCEILLMSMEIQVSESFPSSTTSAKIQDWQKIQHIGRIIYEIFRDNQSDNQLFLGSKFRSLSLSGDPCDYMMQQSSKVQRHKEESLFSNLVESGHYPASVCRLLSDMIDVGMDGMAHSPFLTLQDVIKDLNQMYSFPQLHLDDPEAAFFSSNLRFGKGCYGRLEQVMKILKVASNLEGIGEGEVGRSSECAEAIFVSGIAGSGKTFLIQSVSGYLTSQGWIVVGAKFEMGLEHESLPTTLSVFDKLVSTLVSMRDGGIEKDEECSRRAREAISSALDSDDMSLLSNLLPSINDLFVNENHNNGENADAGAKAVDLNYGSSRWRLVFLLSSLLGAVLSADCHILIYFDDLQWCDGHMLGLITEIIVSMGRLFHANKCFLFVGMYRDNEVSSDSHPFTSQYNVLKNNTNVNITSIRLSSLSRSDVTDMLMAEMRLPRRLVVKLANFVHKRTSGGHALSVVQFLNMIARQAIVAYSPTKKRYHWDYDQLKHIQTLDGVASLIVSNLSSLPPKALRTLQILSCFGAQVHEAIIDQLELCSNLEGSADILSSIPKLKDEGILEAGNSMIRFCHDLIREQVYNGIVADQRRQMHLCIGTFLGSKTTFDVSMQHDDGQNIKEDTGPLSQLLVFVATDHVNNASGLVIDQLQKDQFSEWNLCAANEAFLASDFQAALHYCKSGISFLGSKVWTEGPCYSLHRGATVSLLALDEAGRGEAKNYANIIIQNVTFEKSLEAQYLLIRSLIELGSFEEAMATALPIIRKLGFNIPSAPKLWLSFLAGGVQGISPSVFTQSMKEADEVTSQYDLNAIIDKQAGEAYDENSILNIQKRTNSILNILEVSICAGANLRSPYLPLIVCQTVIYSLKNNCVYGESALAFCYFGYLKMWLDGNFREGTRYGNLALKILKKSEHRNPFTRTRVVLYGMVLYWSRPLKESAHDLFQAHKIGLKYGVMTAAWRCLAGHLNMLFHAGEKLPILQKRYNTYLKQMAKHSKEAAKFAILPKIKIDLLMGMPCTSFTIFDGLILDENSLLAYAVSKKNLGLVINIYFERLNSDFWMGNYSDAMKWYKLALPYSKRQAGPMFWDKYVLMARGIIAFHSYRGGKGEAFFDEGKLILDELEGLLERSRVNFMNKFLLVQAEFYASDCEIIKAKEKYEASIQTARTQGLIHEEGLAYELMGRYLASIMEHPEAQRCHRSAYSCYMQWGALAKMKQLQEDSDVDLSDDEKKHGRDW